MSEISFETPDPHDLLDIDSLLSDEEILLRDTVRNYVDKEINPNVADWWEDGEIPHTRTWRRPSASWACSGCTSRGTDVPGPRTPPTA